MPPSNGADDVAPMRESASVTLGARLPAHMHLRTLEATGGEEEAGMTAAAEVEEAAAREEGMGWGRVKEREKGGTDWAAVGVASSGGSCKRKSDRPRKFQSRC